MRHTAVKPATLGKLLLGILAFLVLFPVVLLVFINTPPGRTAFSSAASQLSGRPVELAGHIYPVFAWPPTLHVSGLTVANTGTQRHGNMAEIGVMEASISTRALLYGKLQLHKLALVNSSLHLEKNAQGIANWQSQTPAHEENKETSLPSLGTVYLENSEFTYIDAQQKTDLSLKAASEGDNFVLKGDGKKEGKPFKLDAQVAARCLTQQAEPCPLEVKFNVGHTQLQAKGTLKSIAPPAGADFMLDLKGADAAELFPLFGIALPPTAPYHLAGHLTYEGERWHFADFTGNMGESDLQGSAIWDMSARKPHLTATLVSRQLRFADLGPLIGLSPPVAVSQEQKAYAAKREEDPLIIPDLPLDITKISSLNADVTFTGKQIISPNLPLDDFYLKLSLQDRVLRLMPVTFGTANGTITTHFTVDANQNPVSHHANVHFEKLSLAGLLGKVGQSLGDIKKPEGFIAGRMVVSGHGRSLHEMLSDARGTAAIGMTNGKISNLLVKLLSLDIARSLGFLLTGDEPVAIRCVAASFDVHKGMMTTDRFVIDTADTNITGEGTVNLASEQMKLRIMPAPKEPTVLSLRSPLAIEGTLKAPSVSLEKGPLAARGAIAAGLAVVAPLAAAVAFLDTGAGEDSDCDALMQHINTKTGKTVQKDADKNF